jgi:outer membrane receptor protein involved in Fe transport
MTGGRHRHPIAESGRLAAALLPGAATLLAASVLLAFMQALLPGQLPAQERLKEDSTAARRGVEMADTASRHRDSVVIYAPPPSWGSLDTQLPSASTLSRAALSWQPGRWIGEAFHSMAGFTLLDPGSEGQYAEIFARGIDGRGVGFLVDGRSVQDPLSGLANPYHLRWIGIDRIEVVTGPRSFLYGLNTQGAAINLVTRDFNAVKPYSRIAYGEGPDEFSFSDGEFIQNFSRRLNLHAGFQHLGTDGAYPNSPHDQWNVGGRVRYHISGDFALILSGQYLATQTGLNGGIAPVSAGSSLAFLPLRAPLVNTDAYEKLTRGNVDLSLAGNWADSTALFRATLYTSNELREYRDEENRALPNGILIRSDHRVSTSGLTARQELSAGPFALLAGGMAEAIDVKESPALGPRTEAHTALWGRAEAFITPALRASAFTRIEKFCGTAGAGIGGDLDWAVTPALSLFGGISRSDRLPTLFEKFWTDSTVARTQAVESEHHTHAEAGIELRPSSAFRLRAAFFSRAVERPIEILEDSARGGFPGIAIRQGGGKRTITGGEATLSAQIWHILLEGTGTFLASTGGGDAPPDRVPKVQARGGLYLRGVFFDGSLDLKTGLRGTFSSSFVGDRFDGAALAWGASRGASAAAWSRADFVLTAGISDAHIDFLWENLTGVKAFAARYYALPERGIWFRIVWEFLN